MLSEKGLRKTLYRHCHDGDAHGRMQRKSVPMATGWLSVVILRTTLSREWCVDLVHLTAFLNAAQPRLAKGT